jgi:putative ABC transport system substrate-binding protein
MRRREFIASLVGAVVGWPSSTSAQQASTPAVGVLVAGSPGSRATAQVIAAFRRGLDEAGFVEGQNVALEYCFAEGHFDRMPALAADLVRRQVAVIFSSNTPAARAAKDASATIPIVFSAGGDPVQLGLVGSLNRPGANLTGVYQFTTALDAKRLELLHELIPRATTIAALVNPNYFARGAGGGTSLGSRDHRPQRDCRSRF